MASSSNLVFKGLSFVVQTKCVAILQIIFSGSRDV